MSVLVLAEDVDSTADQVVNGLIERGVDVARLNTAWFPSTLHLSVRLRRGRWSGTVRTVAREIDVESVTAVWYRSPRAYQVPDNLSVAERAHINREGKYGLGGVLSSLSALWVNHPARNADAAYKPVQLTTAHRCGLLVPDTLITQDPDAVRAFAVEGPTVSKLLGSNTIREQGVQKITYTRLLDPAADLADLGGIEATTHLFQRWVPKAFEARMIVIGDDVTTTAIRARTTEAQVDWRSDYEGLDYELVTPPPHVVAGVQDLTRSLGLVYGALDFVVTPAGEWVFLEINPAGQFGWIEAATGAALHHQLADLLAKGAAR